MKVVWLDSKLGRTKGQVEDNEEWLCKTWEEAGFVRRATKADLERSEKAVEGPPENRSLGKSPVKR